MRIGLPKERKPDERRVALTPSGAEELVAARHQLLLEAGAGEGTHFEDDDYAVHGLPLEEPRALAPH